MSLKVFCQNPTSETAAKTMLECLLADYGCGVDASKFSDALFATRCEINCKYYYMPHLAAALLLRGKKQVKSESVKGHSVTYTSNSDTASEILCSAWAVSIEDCVKRKACVCELPAKAGLEYTRCL